MKLIQAPKVSSRSLSIWLLCLAVLCASSVRAQEDEEYQLISMAERYVGEVITGIPRIIAAPDSQWQPLELPYIEPETSIRRLEDSETLWVRVANPLVSGDAAELPQSLYIWRHSIRVAVYLDDRYLGGTDKDVWGMPSSAWNQPVLLQIPFQSSDTRYFYFKIEGGPSGPILSPIMVGSQPVLQSLYDSRNFWQIQASQLAFGLSLILGVFSLWLWSKRRQDRLYLKFSLMSFLWCVGNAFSFITFIPYSMTVWLVLVHSSFDWSAFLLVSFTLEATAVKQKFIANFLFWLAVVATVVHLIIPNELFLTTAYLFNAVQTLTIIGIALLVIWHTLTRRESTSFWFSAAYVGMCGLMAHDFFVVFIGSDETHIAASNLAHLSLPLITVAFYAHLITRFVGALDTSEKLNTELENRVEASREELSQSYAENRQLELKQATDSERTKIYRDLHDDVGSKLTSILHSSPQLKTKTLARSALESLRVSIFRANYQEAAVSSVLIEVIEEAQLRITSAGLQFVSHQDLPNDSELEAEKAYHLVRMFREIISNILHHAQASKVTIKLGIENTSLVCEVQDNGMGLGDGGSHASGGGLANTEYRAEVLGGAISFEDTGAGTLVSFSIPLPDAGKLDLNSQNMGIGGS